MIKPLQIESKGGRVVKVNALTPDEVMQKLEPRREQVWQPTDIYDTQLSTSTIKIETSIDKLVLRAERIIERRLLKWIAWAALCCFVLLLIH